VGDRLEVMSLRCKVCGRAGVPCSGSVGFCEGRNATWAFIGWYTSVTFVWDFMRGQCSDLLWEVVVW